MDNYAEQLSIDWNLGGIFSDRLAALPLTHLQSCQDINIALGRLLGSAELVCKWMWRPKPWLYHVRPVQVVLASRHGCEHIRLCLLRDLADLREDFGVYAVLESALGLEQERTNHDFGDGPGHRDSA